MSKNARWLRDSELTSITLDAGSTNGLRSMEMQFMGPLVPCLLRRRQVGYRTYYTRSRNSRYTYALASKLGRNGKILYKAKAKEETEVKLLGYENSLECFNSDWGLNILLSEDSLDYLPSSHAGIFHY